MTTTIRSLLLLTLLTAAGCASAPTLDQDVRLHDPRTAGFEAKLDTLGATLDHPSAEVRVSLYGVIHIADAQTWTDLTRDLATADVVIYEGVTPESASAMEDLGPVFAEEVLTAMGLVSQQKGLDYSSEGWTRVDLPPEELERAIESLLPPELGNKDQLDALVTWAGPMLKIALATNPKLSGQLKLAMARKLAQPSNGPDKLASLHTRREALVLDAIADEAKRLGRGRIAVVYGAAHVPPLARKLVERGYELSRTEWRPAWTFEHPGTELSLSK